MKQHLELQWPRAERYNRRHTQASSAYSILTSALPMLEKKDPSTRLAHIHRLACLDWGGDGASGNAACPFHF